MKNTRRALLLSALSLVMCVAMLIGSTFAWFTDSASTAVNSIVSGTLDIAFEYSTDNGATWQNAEGQTLNWVTADGRTDNILWEPNCTYELPLIRVRNNGNLALKYEIAVTGVTGDAKLLDVIDFTASIDGAAEVELATMAGHLDAYNDESVILIKGHMDKDAGNDYQDLTITGIAINVLATQYTYENDSISNQYDANAVYPVFVTDNGAFIELGNQEIGLLSIEVPVDAVEDGVGAINTAMTNPIITKIVPTDISSTLKTVYTIKVIMDGIKENNTVPMNISYIVPGTDDYVGVEVFVDGVGVANAEYNNKTRTVDLQATSKGEFEIVLDTGAVIIPEDYTNEEAISLITSAKDGAIIDGNNRVITLPDNVTNKWSLLIQYGITLKNVTLKAKGDGATVMIYGQNKDIKFQNVTFQNTKYGKKALEISKNTRNSLVFEDCTIKGKPYVQGANVTFVRCSFNTNMNLEYATNITIKDSTFTVSGAITMAANLTNILLENNVFKYSTAVKLYSGSVPTNVQLIGNTYNTTLVSPQGSVDYEGFKASGAWIEINNIKK